MLTPVTRARLAFGTTSRTCALLPRSLPLIAMTWSSFLILFTELYHLWCERHDLHEVALAQLSSNWTKDSRAARVLFVAQDHRGVVVEANVGAISTAVLLGGTDDDGVNDLALLHGRPRL